MAVVRRWWAVGIGEFDAVGSCFDCCFDCVREAVILHVCVCVTCDGCVCCVLCVVKK